MSVSAGINTSIKDELSCLETGSNEGNNKASSLGNPPNEHHNGTNSDGGNSDSSVKDDLETDSSCSNPSGHARISYPNASLTDNSSLEETDIEADGNNRSEIRDSVLSESSESNISNNTPSTKYAGTANSSFSITGIVQRNLGSPTSNNSIKMKESVYNFDEDEEHAIPPKPAYSIHSNSPSHRFSGSFSAKPASPAMVFV